jgi:hypothetical protein
VDIKRFFGRAADRVGDAAGRIVAGAVSTATGVARNVGDAVGSFASGIEGLATGHLGDGLGHLGLSLVEVVQTPVDAVLMAGGALVSAAQTLIGAEPPGRRLAGDEIELLRNVYRDSIEYSRIRIKEGNAGLLTLPNRPFTHGDTIYVPKDWLPMAKRLLVHETAHVWQHQNGGTHYMSESLFAQYIGDGYDYGKALREGKKWSELNPEQQAEVVEMAFARDLFSDPDSRFIHDSADYTEQVREMIAELRAGRGAHWRARVISSRRDSR